ncbi:hypothetical protein E4U55_007147 [Claviceps digitariae]|nr:hypothetical protein E4U55_007147 [Claviceps digitariae]
MHLTGNKPPWTLAAKSKHLALDAPRAASRVGITFATPPDFLSRVRTQSALRALLFIKANYPTDTFLSALRFLLYRFWTPPNADVVEEDSLRGLLTEATRDTAARGGGGGDRLFSQDEVEDIMAGRAQMKKLLAEETEGAVKAGAFGCPWWLVADSRGQVEPFFGSDRYVRRKPWKPRKRQTNRSDEWDFRFNHIYRHLGIPFQDIAVLEPATGLGLAGSASATASASERGPKL